MIWFVDPSELIRQDKLLDFWPTSKQDFSERINSGSRFIVYSTIVAFALKKDPKIILLGILVLTGLFIFFKMTPALKGATPFNKNDPMSNFTDEKIFDKSNSDSIMKDVFPDDTRNAERNFFTMPTNDLDAFLQGMGRGFPSCREGFCTEDNPRQPEIMQRRAASGAANILPYY